MAAHDTDGGMLPRSLMFSSAGAPAQWLTTFRITGHFIWSLLCLDIGAQNVASLRWIIFRSVWSLLWPKKPTNSPSHLSLFFDKQTPTYQKKYK